ncbi:MAG: hypothetical protein DRH07_05155 [Deltaproteobacteria bacterium]|nr:MAG: hypothetical protein DRH07_05155 [Deltaproteobacteria bacterium]
MNWLQICSFGAVFSSFLPHSYGYEPANELKTVINPPDFRFSPYSPHPPRILSMPPSKNNSIKQLVK